jgi:hypothetical protein
MLATLDRRAALLQGEPSEHCDQFNVGRCNKKVTRFKGTWPLIDVYKIGFG